MSRNLIPGLKRVDWSDSQRQSEYVNSVVSALNGLGDTMDYDYVCAVSGSAFRASFSMPSHREWNHGNYHVINAPIIIEHTFKMLGYSVTQYILSDYAADSRLIMASIDRGFPVITIEGVINCADACVISGYDNDGQVLLGYNPFMDVEDDHNEAHDASGYFRKSHWHECACGRVIIIDEKIKAPDRETVFCETAKLISRLIGDECLWPGQHNGLAAHRAFAGALLTYEWADNFQPYLNVMCNYKQYLDRQYAERFFRDNGRNDLADIYKEITELCLELAKIIPQDFSAVDMFSDKVALKPYADALLGICALEEDALKLLS